MKKTIGIVLVIYALMCIFTYVFVMLDTEHYITNNEFDPKFKRLLRESFIPKLSSDALRLPDGATKIETSSFLITQPKLIEPTRDRWKHQLFLNSSYKNAKGKVAKQETCIVITVMLDDNGDYSIINHARQPNFRSFTRNFRYLFRFHWKDTFSGFEPVHKVKYDYSG